MEALQDPSKPPDELVEHLESIVRGFVAAINAADWDPTSKAWSHMAGNFRIGVPNDSRDQPKPFSPGKLLSLSDFCATWKEHTADLPDYRLDIQDLFTSVSEDFVDTDGGRKPRRANVFITLAVTGDPPGVVRQNVGIYDFVFRETEQRWVCQRMESYRGMDAMGT